MYKSLDDISLAELDNYFNSIPLTQLDKVLISFWNMLDRHYPVLLNIRR